MTASLTFRQDAVTLHTDAATTKFSVFHGHLQIATQVRGARTWSTERLTKAEGRAFADALRDLIRNDDLTVGARNSDTLAVRAARKIGSA